MFIFYNILFIFYNIILTLQRNVYPSVWSVYMHNKGFILHTVVFFQCLSPRGQIKCYTLTNLCFIYIDCYSNNKQILREWKASHLISYHIRCWGGDCGVLSNNPCYNDQPSTRLRGLFVMLLWPELNYEQGTCCSMPRGWNNCAIREAMVVIKVLFSYQL